MYGIGIDIGATNLRVAISDENGNISIKIAENTIRTGVGEDVTKQIIRMCENALNKLNIDLKDIAGIGIGSIGPLDLKNGVIVNPANLPFNQIPLVKPLSQHFRKTVFLLNDCTTAVVGEKHFGTGKDVKNLVYITLSTGIGGGAYVDNHLLIGKDGNAVEIGHIVIDFEERLTCGCGKRGHWEAYCSGTGIPKLVKMLYREKRIDLVLSSIWDEIKGDLDKITSKMIYDHAKKGDEIALEITDFIGKLNAIGIASVINVYDPEIITLGGSIALKNPKLVLDPINKYIDKYIINRKPKIILTPLGEDVVLYGAIALAFGKEKSVKYIYNS